MAKTGCPCGHQTHGHYGPRVSVEEAVGDQKGYIHRTILPEFCRQEYSFPGNLWVSLARAFSVLGFQDIDKGSEDMRLVPEGLIS